MFNVPFPGDYSADESCYSPNRYGNNGYILQDGDKKGVLKNSWLWMI